jgi:coproporphyrinogen III oxidase-like Fe-S oxidoreductase
VKEGVDLALFRSMFDIDFEKRFAPIIEQTREEGLGGIQGNRYALTLEGQIRLDSILEAFADRILTN